MRVRESFARDLLRLAVWYPLRWLLVVAPPRLGLWIMRRMGDLHFTLSRGRRAVLAQRLETLAPGLGAAEKDRQVREYFRAHYVNQMIIFLFPRLRGRRLERFVEIEGLERIEGARGQGRGVVLVHGHLGPSQLPLAVLGRLGLPMMQIGFPTDEGLSFIGRTVAFRLRLRYEGMIEATIIKPGGDLRPLVSFVKEGGVAMAPGDGEGAGRRFGKYGEFSFCGRRAAFPLGPARLAQKTGAALIPQFLAPGEKTPFRIVIGEPLNADGEKDPEVLTGRFLALFERQVAARPGWWRFLERFESGGLLLE